MECHLFPMPRQHIFSGICFYLHIIYIYTHRSISNPNSRFIRYQVYLNLPHWYPMPIHGTSVQGWPDLAAHEFLRPLLGKGDWIDGPGWSDSFGGWSTCHPDDLWFYCPVKIWGLNQWTSGKKTKHMDFFNQNIRVSQTGKYSKRLISSPNLERLGKNGYIQASIRCKSTLVVQWWYNGSGNQLVNYVNIK